MAPAHYIKGAHADMSQPNMREAPPSLLLHILHNTCTFAGWHGITILII